MLGELPVAVLTSDSEGNVEFLNPAAEALTGQCVESALGRPMSEVLSLGDVADGTPIECPAAACFRAQTSTGPLEARVLSTPDSPPRVVEVSAGPIRDLEGRVRGAILMARDVTKARQMELQLTHQATHDALTGLVNRAEFERRLARALASTAAEGAHHALGFLDLDGFKRVNDACGHQAGDELLQELGNLLRGQMRARDTVGRLGGDEFGILLEHCGPAKAVRLAEQIRKTIADHRFSCGGRTFTIGASIGVVPVRNGGSSAAELLGAADAECYTAKRQGGNRIHLSIDHTGGSHAHIYPAHAALSRVRPQP